MTKKYILISSIVGTLFLGILFFLAMDFCYESVFCRMLQKSLSNDLLLVLFVFPPLLLLSLITLEMPESVFRAWWNFARWWIPIIMLGTVGANLYPSSHGFFNMDALIYPMVLGPLYIIFVFGSLRKILQAKKSSN